ncbi:hypothetical protein N7466_007238 [Penicillium verhagenii]|uniref:uncharacterized protein n=1 Tax=Penicillium verhagenii TaxID=1562060 RepID=UPI00254585A1|nr:uncharacterized protein N7466_007238 [Penicillium verhagenii]KAJ5928282.1 hypothetical protein N7466_007238 [Penicillium verhagenii]
MQHIRALRPSSRTITTLARPQSGSLRTALPINTIVTRECPSRRQLTPPCTSQPQKRAFNLSSLASFLPNGNNNGNDSPKRVLNASRILPYSPALLFKVVSSVEAYSEFLPFLAASTVTARDPQTGYPTQAFLTIGYGPFNETFTSLVDCDPAKGIVEARSGAKFGKPEGSASSSSSGSSGLSGFFPGATEGIFEYLSTRWELAPVDVKGGSPHTKVNLEVQFEFKNQMHSALMGAVEGQMAGVMIEAFEKRMKTMHVEGQ